MVTTTVVTRTVKTAMVATEAVAINNVRVVMVVVISNAKAVVSSANRTKSRLPICRW